MLFITERFAKNVERGECDMADDRRKKRTEELIRGTFFEMLAEMPAYKITVAELCRRANINRGTFYLHYQDCYDLIEALSAEIADRFEPYVAAICRDRATLRESVMTMLPILVEDKDSLRLIQSSELCSQIISRHFRGIIEANWKRLSGISDAQADMIYSYITGGVFAAVREMEEGKPDSSPEELYESVCRLVTGGLSAFVPPE